MAETTKKKNVRGGYAADNAKRERFSKGLTDTSGRDGFVRPKIEVGRWSLAMDILRNNFGKLIGFNLAMMIFIAPIVALIFLRWVALTQTIVSSPFAANVGLGFQPNPNLFALAESLEFLVTWRYFIFLPIAVVILGVGFAGGMFVMRNLAWGERIRVYKVFFVGIKRNALTLIAISLFYGIILSGSLIGLYYVNYAQVAFGAKWYIILIKVLIIVLAAYFTVWYFTATSVAVTYSSGVGALMRNSFKLATVLLPTNVFFLMLGAIAFELLFMGSSFMLFAFLIILMFGVSFFMLVWSVYSQWVFDRFVNPTIKEKYKPTPEEIEARKLREKAEREVERNDGFISVGQSVVSDLGRIRPIAEGETEMVTFNTCFTRADLEKARDAKIKMAGENEAPAETKDNKKK